MANGGAHNIYVEKERGQSRRIWGKGGSQMLPTRERVGSAWFPHQLGPRAGRLKGGHFVLGPGAAHGSVSGISQM